MNTRLGLVVALSVLGFFSTFAEETATAVTVKPGAGTVNWGYFTSLRRNWWMVGMGPDRAENELALCLTGLGPQNTRIIESAARRHVSIRVLISPQRDGTERENRTGDTSPGPTNTRPKAERIQANAFAERLAKLGVAVRALEESDPGCNFAVVDQKGLLFPGAFAGDQPLTGPAISIREEPIVAAFLSRFDSQWSAAAPIPPPPGDLESLPLSAEKMPEFGSTHSAWKMQLVVHAVFNEEAAIKLFERETPESWNPDTPSGLDLFLWVDAEISRTNAGKAPLVRFLETLFRRFGPLIARVQVVHQKGVPLEPLRQLLAERIPQAEANWVAAGFVFPAIELSHERTSTGFEYLGQRNVGVFLTGQTHYGNFHVQLVPKEAAPPKEQPKEP